MNDFSDLKKDFPIFKASPELVYLDSPATALKPQGVIDAIHKYYEEYGVSVHRGLYSLAEKATAEFEAARETVRVFLNAKHTEEIIFVRNATEGISQRYGTPLKHSAVADVII
jgi:cysteine desulfurase / selenocysteine lyase